MTELAQWGRISENCNISVLNIERYIIEHERRYIQIKTKTFTFCTLLISSPFDVLLSFGNEKIKLCIFDKHKNLHLSCYSCGVRVRRVDICQVQLQLVTEGEERGEKEEKD